MDPLLLASYLVALLFDIGMPIVLAVVVRRRLGVSWRYFWYGAAIFFVFQLVTRIPAVQILQATVLAEPLRQSESVRWAWLFALALTAGLFEEVGRYLGYRYLVFRGTGRPGDTATGGHGDGATGRHGEVAEPGPPRPLRPLPESPQQPVPPDPTGTPAPAAGTSPAVLSWRRGVMYGLGHGGLESMLFVGGLVAIAIVNALVITRMDLAAVPPDQRQAFEQARAVFETMAWWLPLVGALERLLAVTLQVAFSILVLQVFLRGSLRWLYLAILAHFLVDLATVASARPLGQVGTEGVLALFAAGGLFLIFRLKPADSGPPR